MNKKPYTISEFFNKVKKKLEVNGRMPAIIDYALPSDSYTPIKTDEFNITSRLKRGGSEGIYLDLYIEAEGHIINLGTIKTLYSDDDAMRTMGSLIGDIVLCVDDILNEEGDNFIWEGFNVKGSRFDTPLMFSYETKDKARVEVLTEQLFADNCTAVTVKDYKNRTEETFTKDVDAKTYGGLHFKGVGNDKVDIKDLVSKNSLKMWDTSYEDEPRYPYDHGDFYKAMGSTDDIFFCYETGRYYVPCEHEMMEYRNYPKAEGR